MLVYCNFDSVNAASTFNWILHNIVINLIITIFNCN